MIQKLTRINATGVYKKIITALLIALVLACSMTLMGGAANTSYKVTIYEPGAETQVETRKTTAKDILDQAGFVLKYNDIVDTSNFVSGKDSQITIFRACKMTVIDAGKSRTVTGCKTVGDSLTDNWILVGQDDYISVPLEKPVSEGMTVTIERAFSVFINADDENTRVKIATGTVADAIEKSGIQFDKNDKTVPSLDTPLSKGLKIKVLRVDYVKREVTKPITYESTTKLTSALPDGQTKLISGGSNGEKKIVYLDKFVDSTLEKTTVVSVETTKAPVKRIILKGSSDTGRTLSIKSGLSAISDLTPPASLEFDANGLPVNYKKLIKGTSTAYSGGGTTSTGRPAMEGYVAVDPDEIPYGTKLYVVSADGKYVYGYCIAADTGGFIYHKNGATIDIYMNTESQCVQFGRRAVNIYVLG